MQRAAEKMVPKVLNFEQKKCRMDIVQEMLMTFNNDPDLLKNVITGDELLLKPKSNRPNGNVEKSQDQKKHVQFGQTRRFCSLLSSLAAVWCIMNSCHKVLRTVNKEYYLEVVHRLSKPIRQKLTELWKNQSWILHHAYISMLVREILVKNKTVIMRQPLYSSDLSPADEVVVF